MQTPTLLNNYAELVRRLKSLTPAEAKGRDLLLELYDAEYAIRAYGKPTSAKALELSCRRSRAFEALQDEVPS